MYAIVEFGGRQWKVQEGSRLEVNRVGVEAGKSVELDRVLLTQDGKDIKVGTPFLQGAKVVCDVVDHFAGEKVISFKFRRRENYRKTVGHRQPLTRLVVKRIEA